MASGIRVPDAEELRALATRLGLRLSEAEVASYPGLMVGVLNAYRRVEELALGAPRVKYPRTPGWKPPPEENPFNGWYRRTEIKGAERGLLAGKRVAVKDAICVAGVPMMAGSRVLEGFTPDVDATVITRLLDAGATIAGKANCEDFSFTGSGHSCANGPVRNPHKLTHSPGGSSNGSAVVIAAGDVDMAIGTDQGGSIRIPAAWSGVVGLKPTYGLVPYTGAMVMEMTLDHIGPMADRVENVARLLSVMAGPDPLDPRQRGIIPEIYVSDYMPALGRDVRGVRIALLKEGFSVEPNDALGLPGGEPVVDRKVRAALKELEKRGARVDEVSVPMHRDGTCIWFAIHVEGPTEVIKSNGLGSGWSGWYNTRLAESFAKGFRAHANDLSHTVKLVLLIGEHMRQSHYGLYYAMGQNLRDTLRRAYDDVLASYDLIAMPTVPFRATPLPPADCTIEDYVGFGLNMIHNTGQFNVTGHPAISVPCGMEDGLPIGLMLVGRHFDDLTVLRVADAVERIADWRTL